MRILCFVILGLLAAAVQTPATDYQVIGIVTTDHDGLARTEATVQVDAGPLDQFKMVRLRKRGQAGPRRGSILLLPPAGFAFTFYEQPGARDDADSFAEFFARRGYDVYGYSPRVDGLVAGACEGGVFDCSAIAGWGLQSMVDDIAFIREWIETEHPDGEVVVGGFSLGAMLAVATVNVRPDDFAGLLVWEGMLYSENPEVLALSGAYCPALQAAIDAGVLFDGVTLNVFHALGELVDQTPSGLTPIPLFPPFFSNHLALVAALSVPTDGPFSQVVPGYILAAGDVTEDRLQSAVESRVVATARRLYNYLPLAMIRDWHCALAGSDDTHVANLEGYTAPVLALGAGHGYGPYMQDQLDRLGSSEVEFQYRPGFAHVDHFWSADHREVLERPILRWLRRVLE